jgi:polyisoprenoid-binding protein YceI
MFFMKLLNNKIFMGLLLIVISCGYIISCKHENELLISTGPKIERGTLVLNFPSDTKVSYDKTHGNVGWETPFLGGLSNLTGRFNTFGMNTFNFDEANPANSKFEAWVWVNSVNTSEPGRDGGCLQTTFGTTTAMTTDAANVAIIRSKSIEKSTSDKGYIVKFDLIFHGATKELTGKLMYDGVVTTGSGAAVKNTYGFSFDFQFLAKTDFGIVSNNVADNITVKCNAIFIK